MAAKARNGPGRLERARSHEGRTRKPALTELYKRRLPPITPGEFAFEWVLLRGRGNEAINITSATESCEWVDEGPVLTGSIALKRPDPDDPRSLPVARGHQVRCRVWWRDAWYELWTMRCSEPETDLTEGRLSVELTDDLDLVRGHVREWTYRKTKRRKNGWRPHLLARDVLRVCGARPGQIAEVKSVWVRRVVGWMSALDALTKAYEVAHKETRIRYVIRMRNGRVDIVPFRRNPIMYELHDLLVDALLRREGVARPTTVITGRGKVGKGKAAKKIEHTEYRRAVVQRLGYVHREKNYGRVDSRADLVKQVKRELAKELKLRPSATLSVPGVPFIGRGDATMVELPAEGFEGEQAVVFTTRVAHSVDGQTYRTDLDVGSTDPYEKYREQREKELRDKKRKQREQRREEAED